MRITIAWKIGLLITVPVIVVATLVGMGVYSMSMEELRNHEKIDLRDEAKLRTEGIQRQISTLREDVLKLVGAPPIHGIVRAKRAEPLADDPVDPLSGRKFSDFYGDLVSQDGLFHEICFDELGNVKPYLQVRLIEKTYSKNEIPVKASEDHAREIVRLDRELIADHKYHFLSKPGESKGDRDYFRETWRLAMSQQKSETEPVYLSCIELNFRDGRKHVDEPVLRAAAPVYDSQDEFFGIVIINLDLRQLEQDVVGSPRHLIYVTNDAGDFLLHPQRAKGFVWDYTDNLRRCQIQNEPGFAEIAHLFPPTDQGDYQLKNEYVSVHGFEEPIETQAGILARRLETQGIEFREDFVPPDDAFALVRFGRSDEASWSQMYETVQEELVAIAAEQLEDGTPKYRGYVFPPRLTKEAPSFQLRASKLDDLQQITKRLMQKFPREIKVIYYPTMCRTFAAHFFRIYFDRRHPERHLGFLMAFSFEEMDADLLPTKRWIVRSSVALTCLVGIIAFVLSQLAVRRLQQVTRASESIAKGNYDVTLPVHRGDEIGDLARGFQLMIREVRAQGKEIREREARLRMIVSCAAEGIVLLDQDGAIRSSNLAAERIFLYQASQLEGKPVQELVAAEYRQRLLACLETISGEDSSAPSISLEALGRRSDGATFPLEVSISSVLLEEQRIYTLIMHDITERKRNEEKIKKWNEELQKAVDFQTAELKDANERLMLAHRKAEELSRAKDAFLASVSHELRNPLNQVSGFCQLLEMSDLDEEQLADVHRIQLANDQLLALINDILDYQKIIMGGITVESEEIDVRQLLKQVQDAMKVQANENKNELKFECADDVSTLYADQQRVRQVLLNLISNACKFTEKGSVTVTVSRRSQDGSHWLELAVQDTGRGMTVEEQAKLFTPFTKLSAKQGNRSGTGLGLVISKGFCELMRGDIQLVSEFGQGSTFTIRMPEGKNDRVPGAPQKPTPPGDTKRPSQRSLSAAKGQQISAALADVNVEASTTPDKLSPGRLILAIDDDPSVCEMIQRYLSGQGFQVVTATSGLEGLQLAKRLQPAAITLDAKMPGMDGWAVLGALKASDETASIPVVMVSILDEEEKGYTLGATDFISKPIDWKQLTQSLAKFTGQKRERSILVVDDDAATREILRRSLEQDGWSVLEAENGAVALEMLAQDEQRPAAIVLDLMMPVMNGFDFVVEFSQRAEWFSVPIIVLSAKDPTPEERELLEGQVVRVLRKGHYSQEDLFAEIHRRVDRHIEPDPIQTEGS